MHIDSAFVWREAAHQHIGPGDGQFPRRIYVTLGEGDTAWDPTSSKRLVRGPAQLTYLEWDDGGVTLKVEQ